MDSDQPILGATPWQATVRFWLRAWIVFGRASRSEFWWWVLISLVVGQLLITVPALIAREPHLLLGSDDPLAWSMWPSNLWVLATAVPSITLTARRLHDTDRSGWWQLLAFVPVIGWIILIVWCASPPKPAGVRYDRTLAAQAAAAGSS